MDMTQLEEGEAFPYPYNDEKIDPVEAFTHIDERIEVVLGQYRKEFESGFSQESLGALFGSYGSFLPSYKRPPSILCNQRNPQEGGKPNASCAQQNRPFEDSRPNSVVLPRETLEGRNGPHSDTVPPATLNADINSSSKIQHSGECGSRDSKGKIGSNQNSKLQIKMGSKNVLPQKCTEIYSGLGLDMSPDSSEEDSPALSTDNLGKPQQMLDESPSNIIKMMTSILPPDGLLLSPLEDSLVHFSEEKYCSNNIKCSPLQEKLTVSGNELAPEKSPLEVRAKKNTKIKDQGGNSIERMTAKENDSCGMKLTSDIKCEVQNAAEGTLKNSRPKIRLVKSGAGTPIGTETPSSSLPDEQSRQTCAVNAEAGFAGNRSNRIDGLGVRRDDGVKAVKSCGPSEFIRKKENGVTGEKCELDTKFDKRAPSHTKRIINTTQKKEEPSFEGKSNLKGSSCFPAVKPEGNSMKSLKDMKEPRKRDCGSVGKVKSGDRENRRDSSEILSKKKEKSAKIEKYSNEINPAGDKMRDRSVGETTVSVSKSDATPGGDPSKVTSQNGISSEVVAAETAPEVINESWVLCERCLKWRLLPYGTDLKLLPTKWKCRMLYWLPGMNKCSISEEETTNALNALYFVPVPDTQLNQLSSSDGVSSDVTLSGTKLEKIPREVVSGAVSSGAEEERGRNEASDAGFAAKLLKPKGKRVADPVGNRVLKKAKIESPHHDLAEDHDVLTKEARYHGSNHAELSFPPSQIAKDKKRNSSALTVTAQKHSMGDMSSRKRKSNDFQKLQSYSGISQRKLKETGRDNQKDELLSPRYMQEVSEDIPLALASKQKKVVKSVGVVEKHSKIDVSSKKRKFRDLQDSETHSETRLVKRQKETATQSGINKASGVVLSTKRQSRGDNDAVCKEGCMKNDHPQRQHKLSKLSEMPLDDRSCRRNELGSKKVATISGSSKVQTIRKIKSDSAVNISPVDSVSLSPSRTCNAQKVGKSLLGLKSASNSQRRSTEGKHVGEVSQFEGEMKDKLIHRKPLKLPKSVFSSKADAKSRLSDLERKQDHHAEPNSSPSKNPERQSCSLGSENNSSIASDTGIRRPKEQKDLLSTQSMKCAMKSEAQDCSPYYKEEMKRVKLQNHGNHSINMEKVDVGRKASAQKHPSGHERSSKSGNMGHDAKPTEDKSALKSAYLESPVSVKVNTPRIPESSGFHVPKPSHYSASTALKEANDLKDSAKGLKNSGSEIESTELFFRAALKFLQGASLIEAFNSGGDSSYGEITATEVYGTTAKLCEHCAHEYERFENMAFAALAYKCMEVSYMRMIYSADFLTRGVCHKLQNALEKVSTVESPSSPASAVENMDYQSGADMKDIAKNIDFPRSTGNYIIDTSTQSDYLQLLNFTHDVDLAMEASSKSRDAFAAASESLVEAGNTDGVSSIKSVVDFSFQDVEELLHLISHAMKILRG